ncbi:TetR/AcrR family transcriptional regulator C-terminal domain-containing protein [Streptomyces sp. NPDC005435]|uniref:TetR/AcrR family transcriptional regulator n=1 Tax=Streptomyces sp. NPDC005435 TaxID=3154464 RepID=UPI003453312D
MPHDKGPGPSGVDPERLWLGDPEPRRGRRPSFSRTAITAAAVALADTEGLDAVTMRRVAAEVGAGVMSLYTYAPDKDTLLALMTDHVCGELPRTDPLTGDWRADLKTLARRQRALMLRHPWVPDTLVTRHIPGPRALDFLEHALVALRPSGLDGAARLEVFAQLTAFVAGHVRHELAQAASAGSPGWSPAEARYLTAVATDGHHPELAGALAAAPGRPASLEATFDRFLNRLVDGLDTA